MKCIVLLASAFLFCSPVFGSYESGPGYGVSHSSYPAAPAVHQHGHGWGSQHGAGSYYHYHVPLVGQQHGWQPQQQQNDHHLYYILPLLLIAALPLLLLPLLPLLLLPLGLSLLALLLPLLMMGGMMMMMMMDGGMMMMMMRNHGAPTRNGHNSAESRNFGNLLYHDINLLLTRYARSLDLDRCPERLSCEAGYFLLHSENGTEATTARTLLDFAESSVPKGMTRRLFRSYKQAFWVGSKTGNCSEFKCQPVFKIPVDASTPVDHYPSFTNQTANYADYYKLYGQNKASNNYYDYYNNNNNDNKSNSINSVNYYTTEPSAPVAAVATKRVKHSKKHYGSGVYSSAKYSNPSANASSQ